MTAAGAGQSELLAWVGNTFCRHLKMGSFLDVSIYQGRYPMNYRLLLVLPVLIGFASLASAAPEDMTVSTWDPGCEHTMTTNHFELAPGESVKIDLDMLGCSIYADSPKGLLYFGYYTTKTSSRPLTQRNNVRLTLVDGNGHETVSDSGSIYAEVAAPEACELWAENMNHRKTVKIRLRSSLLD